MPRFPELVLVGRVVKPQGRHGEVAVQSLSDRSDRFPTLRRAYVPGEGDAARELLVSKAWPHKGRWVLKFEGVDSIDAAERLRGLDLGIAEAELAVLPEGSYYHYQLTGLQVEDEAGSSLGRVDEVLETGAETRVLAVRGEGGETLIPLAAAFVRRVDVEHGVMVVRMPEYFGAD